MLLCFFVKFDALLLVGLLRDVFDFLWEPATTDDLPDEFPADFASDLVPFLDGILSLRLSGLCFVDLSLLMLFALLWLLSDFSWLTLSSLELLSELLDLLYPILSSNLALGFLYFSFAPATKAVSINALSLSSSLLNTSPSPVLRSNSFSLSLILSI